MKINVKCPWAIVWSMCIYWYEYLSLLAFPVERRDFAPDAIPVTIQADDQGIQLNDFEVFIPIVDDAINEPEEVFIVVLSEQSSMNSDGLDFNQDSRSSLCRIFDNDGIVIL